MNVLCPRCLSVNRVPAERVDEAPKCGKCGAPLFDGVPRELTQDDFLRYIERQDLPVVVDFWASWCGPCKMMAPVFAQVGARLKTRVRFSKVNTEQEPALASRYQVRSIPTLILFKEGREVQRIAGALDAGRLTDWLRAHV